MTMVEVDAPVVIHAPGVYDGIPEDVYHADPYAGGSLSHSGAKRLLPPSVPAMFKWEREHGRPDKREFDFGRAAHSEVLGVGHEVAVIPDEALGANGATSTKVAKEFIADARARGAVPLKSDDAEVIKTMAAQLRAHPVAAKLFQPGGGLPEQSMFWIDERTGVALRARLDWLPYASDGRLICADYKSTVSVEDAAIAKHCADFRYYIQDVWYRDGITQLGVADDVAFVFVFQAKTPPFLVRVIQLDATANRIGELHMRRAIEIYRDCSETDLWPAYPAQVDLVRLPAWFETRALNEEF